MSIRIDAHQHFWKFNQVRDGWINNTMAVIQCDFMPGDLKPILDKYQFDGCIAVQADQSEEENEFLLTLSKNNNFIKGVIGWVDLRAANVDERFENYSQFKKMKGFRHVLQGETDRLFMLNPQFMNGINALRKYNYTYDILVYTDQLIYIEQLVKAFPNQRFVIDHIAKPDIKNKKINGWSKDIKALSVYNNVWCKVSGMVTEADWQNWKQADFDPYLDIIFDAFGTKRLMFGSDWPVCDIAGGYEKMIQIVINYTSKLSVHEQDCFWGLNAADFYNLN